MFSVAARSTFFLGGIFAVLCDVVVSSSRIVLMNLRWIIQKFCGLI